MDVGLLIIFLQLTVRPENEVLECHDMFTCMLIDHSFHADWGRPGRRQREQVAVVASHVLSFHLLAIIAKRGSKNLSNRFLGGAHWIPSSGEFINDLGHARRGLVAPSGGWSVAAQARFRDQSVESNHGVYGSLCRQLLTPGKLAMRPSAKLVRRRNRERKELAASLIPSDGHSLGMQCHRQKTAPASAATDDPEKR